MTKKPYKITCTEQVTDRHGVKRLYGYTSEGLKIFLNLWEVRREYMKKGIKELKVV